MMHVYDSVVSFSCTVATGHVGEGPVPTAGQDAALMMMARATKSEPPVVCTTEHSGEHAGCGEHSSGRSR